ncbi:UDP-2,3-diacylglucosamine diphosphatase [Mucilaginibacter robiniae]|uniref:UDP-2,3-diacylglucosamine diphosphatase n=1 Tax=Mucilaginibacter robiniae TaxID=2728022 RepID=A0A7L5E0K2_9SPHI|nr:UDP-2,3-diacylglucosamine diphosphatase [Mucilaginibacter robiniae]QJD96755.1 UDP-2,3-diacylglucosamine diphosphatase [Mucilaginibacter robiniae]
MAKREIDILVISDVHLGTYGCHAKELLNYLKSIRPKKVILNGDIIDIWQFSKSYWPESHMKVVRRLLKFVTDGVPVYYLTGNHDEMLRKFTDLKLGKFQLLNKLLLNVDGKKAWIFHGDVFDVTMQHSKWLAKLGAIGYDTLIILNSMVNWCLTALGRSKMSFSQRIKGRVKEAVKFINHFEQTAADLAVDKKYDYVICGHIHHAEIRHIQAQHKTSSVLYLNSGDWVESLTALEYVNGNWRIYQYNPTEFTTIADEDHTDDEDLEAKLDVNHLLEQFKQKVQ